MACVALCGADTNLASARGKLALGEHKEFKTPSEAIRRAERWAEERGVAGTLAYIIEADHEFEDSWRTEGAGAFRADAGGVGAPPA